MKIANLDSLSVNIWKTSTLRSNEECILVVGVEDEDEVSLHEDEDRHTEYLPHRDVKANPVQSIIHVLVR